MAPSIRVKTKSSESHGHCVGDECVALLDPALLADDIAVENAVCTLELHLSNAGTDKYELLAALESVPNLLEFVLSSVNDRCLVSFHDTIMRNFPTKPDEFESCLGARLLDRFSLSLLFIPYPTTGSTPSWIVDHRRSVERAISLLKIIGELAFNEDAIEDGEASAPSSPTTRRSQRSRWQQSRRESRASARSLRSPVIDTKPFAEYGVEVPKSAAESAAISSKILEDQKAILQDYLYAFRREPHAAAFKAAYLAVPQRVEDDRPQEAAPVVSSPAEAPSEADAAPAYPLVQPMKAAVYFDSVDGFGEWRIIIGARGIRDLRQARKRDPRGFQIIVKKMKELSNGHFTDDNHKQLLGQDVPVPIYEAKMTGDTRLVYRIHCAPDFESNAAGERQVILVYGIFTHTQIDRKYAVWNHMSQHLARMGSEYRKRCVVRKKVRRGDTVALPEMFDVASASEEAQATSPDIVGLSKEDVEQLNSLILVNSKFVTFSQALLNSILVDQDFAHVFDVSLREKEIIEHTSSCFVLGRSGTGKTTAMVFKILGIQRTWQTSFKDTMPQPRQLFVTKSRFLAEKVEEYFSKLLQSLDTAKLSPAELKEMASREQGQTHRPLMLDADEELVWRGDLPQRYGALEEHHFPMFSTFDHLCRLLDREFKHILEQSEKEHMVSLIMRDVLRKTPGDRSGGHVSYSDRRRDQFVDFAKFEHTYWRHFPQDLVKGLNPDIVFSEFIGVIKGSEKALQSEEGHLSEEAYLKGSRASNTTWSQREAIWALFNVYCKKKRSNGHFDAADRSRSLIKSLEAMGVPGQAVDFLYVDEAQDNLLIDAHVLRTLCSNPHGMFWAGDTAQTISSGSAFRFNELKALLHNIDEKNPIAKRARPQMFHLTKNYRSHAGIVNCAHSVVQLITTYWPESIDALPEEKGEISGPKPLFLGDTDSANFDRALFGDLDTGDSIQFGARQCILVRDDVARERLRKEVGDIGLILTIYESKGLEFDDVLLYDFFEDSPMEYSQWRVVLNSVAGQKAPEFDEARHGGICRELKSLYVSLTRAKNNLWIVDCSRKADPVRLFWTERGLIENHVPGTPLPKLAEKSSDDEWAEAARDLFLKKRYTEAARGFKRAGLGHEQQVATAFSLREQAEASSVDSQLKNVSSRNAAYVKAAHAFLASVPGADPLEQKSYYRNAGESYANGGDDSNAAEAFANAELYELSAQHYRKAGMFDEALSIIAQFQPHISVDVLESITDVSRLHYLRENNVEKARELFKDEDEALEYMEEYGFDAPRASILEESFRYSEAAESRLAAGEVLEAIRLFTLDEGNEESTARAVDCFLEYMWSHISFGSTTQSRAYIVKGDTPVVELFRTAEYLVAHCNAESSRNEINMFRAVLKNDVNALMHLSDTFFNQGNIAAMILCLHVIFRPQLQLPSRSLPDITAYLWRFLRYVQSLEHFLRMPDPCRDTVFGKVFGYSSSSQDSGLFYISEQSCLYPACQIESSNSAIDTGCLLSRQQLQPIIKAEIGKHLKSTVAEENHLFSALRIVQPCLPFAVYQRCPSGDRCPRYHIDRSGDGLTAYNSFVRIHILHIMILHTSTAFRYSLRCQREWLERLHDAVYPPHYLLGSSHLLSPELIPELHYGKRTIASWAQRFLGTFSHRVPPPSMFLTTLLRSARIAMLFDRVEAYRRLHLIPACAVPEDARPEALLRDKVFIVHDLISMVRNNEVYSLNKGILLLNHILENHLHIDIRLLCDVMDHLCAALIMAQRSQKRGDFHDVTLPKSWIIRLVPQLGRLPSQHTGLAYLYDKNMGNLLEEVYSGSQSDHLSLGPMNIVRNIYFARICRNLCLWGYNSRSTEVRDRIGRAITGVAKPDREITSTIVKQYVYAKEWGDLVWAVRQSTSRSSLDEMIQLYHISEPPTTRPARHVRRITYSRDEDILSLLTTQAVPSVPPSHQPVVQEAREDDPAEAGVDEPAGMDTDIDAENDGNAVADAESITKAVDAEQPDVTSRITPEQIQSAKVITKYLMAYVKRKQEVMDSAGRLYPQFRACADSVSWPSRQLCFLFLGPVLHLVIAITCAKDHLHAAKDAARKKLRSVEHQELENAKMALTRISRLFDKACDTYRALSPLTGKDIGGDADKLRSVVFDQNKLREHALVAQSLVEEIERNSGDHLDWKVDVELAVKGIVR